MDHYGGSRRAPRNIFFVLKLMRKDTNYFERKLVVIQKLNIIELKKRSVRKQRHVNRKDLLKMCHRYDSRSDIEQKTEKGTGHFWFYNPRHRRLDFFGIRTKG